ncbi:CGNR zinc finger domain-containing protein [Mycolicibacterium hodleri]|uniref:CGNR zinc finger domain-containing protein n=1 Tax=Mycolicibacterium hodleri TaxID=49897 RepID=UPI0021F394FB|nr:CGNR zinc finger domain-containing protein [Mycolicibacterium hodleri]
MKSEWSEVLLDLLNTTPVVDGTPTDTLDAAWLRAHGAAGQRVRDVRGVRDDLQRVVRGEAPGAVLDARLRGVTQTPEIVGDVLTWRLEADWPARLVLAWGELQSAMPGRLRPCANGECHLFLLDRSRGGTGRWCSMSECGNRMKARRHYGRAVGKET